MSRATSNFQTPQNNYVVPKALIGMLRFTMFSVVEMSEDARYSNVICMLLLFFNASCRERIPEMSRQKTLFSVSLWSRASQPRHVIRWRYWTTFSPSPSNRHHMIGQLPIAIATCGCICPQAESISALFVRLLVTNWSGMACAESATLRSIDHVQVQRTLSPPYTPSLFLIDIHPVLPARNLHSPAANLNWNGSLCHFRLNFLRKKAKPAN